MPIRTAVALFILSLPLAILHAQVDSSDISSYKQNLFLKLFFPKGIAEGVALRSFIRSDSWSALRTSYSDRESFDELYEDAEELCRGDKTAATLAASIAFLEHKTIPVKLLFGAVLSIPLTMENQEDFSVRINRLPAHIYSPKISDVDKLQHFFFSAFFMRTLKMNWLVRLLGNGVETGEDLFIVGGENDLRDRHANDDGIRFGESPEATLPSEYLTPNP
jgi:hypothetical protein